MRTRTPIKDRFKDRAALVTGGGSGIGRSIVEELAREGAQVVYSDLNPAAHEVADQLHAQGHAVHFVEGNMGDEAFCHRLADEAATRFGRLDFLVNNAFSFVAKGLDATAADWDLSLHVGPVAFARMVQACLPHFRRAGGGAVVNVSSISAFAAQPHRWTYNASKGAVNTLTKCMALDLAGDRVRVNSVSPGWIWTSETLKAAALDGGGREKWDPIWGEYHMLGRCGDAVEIAGPVLFLLSDDASFITGTDLPVDGGYQSLGPEGLGKTTVIAGST
jgi:NAD(P)-dependent dehydrogenase (short-subunit alcohol dehydrogenase family)